MSAASAAQVVQFMCLEDNFGVLVHDPATGATASMDAPEAAPILAALKQKGWRLTDVLVTHHHNDHIGGVEELRAAFPDLRVVAARKDAARIPGAQVLVDEGDVVTVGSLQAKVIETPGHTSGHICYWFAKDALLFAGDTLFAMGAGRAFEAPAAVLHQSVMKLAALPPETRVYCGHEYTASNGRFALTVDPTNAALKKRMEDVTALRARNEPTLPTTIEVELATNPFMRADDDAIKRQLDMVGADAPAVFTELRERKNRG